MRRCLILPPWSAGSLGDEYMVASAAHILAGRGFGVSVAELGYPGSIDNYRSAIGALVDKRVEFVALAHQEDCCDADVGNIVSIGADTLDGIHSQEHSLKVLQGLQKAAAAGKQVHVVSASYSAQSKPVVDALVAKLSGIRWIARDPNSYARLNAIGARDVMLGGDLSSLVGDLPALRLERSSESDGAYVLVAMSPATEGVYGLETVAEGIASMVRDVRGLGVRTIVHDHRDFGGRTGRAATLELTARLKELLPGRNVTFVEARNRIDDTHRIAREAALVVSGYMHLALMASFAGVPAYFLAYHDKGLGQKIDNPLFETGGLDGLKAFAAWSPLSRGWRKLAARVSQRRIRKRALQPLLQI